MEVRTRRTDGRCSRGPAFPEPVAVISLRNAVTYRDMDDDGQPILIITDGVTRWLWTAVWPACSVNVVVASHRLADAVRDFATSITARWQARDKGGAGRHRRNRRQIGPDHRGAAARIAEGATGVRSPLTTYSDIERRPSTVFWARN